MRVESAGLMLYTTLSVWLATTFQQGMQTPCEQFNFVSLCATSINVRVELQSRVITVIFNTLIECYKFVTINIS